MLAASQLSGCDVTPEKIARWKETERGPGKLREAVKSSSLSPALRAQALAALVEIKMSGEALGDLKSAPASEQNAVVHEAVARLGQLAASGPLDATTATQREAKDALFLLRDGAAAADRDAIDDRLIAWTTVDLTARMQSGGQSSEKILLAIGPRAAPRLLQILATEGPNQQQAAAILAKISDAPTRAKAADTLVDSAKKIAGRTRDVPDAMLQSLGLLGGAHAVAFLVDTAQHGATESLRERALYALAQGGSASVALTLDAAVHIASDKKEKGKIREAAFQLMEKLGEPSVPSLIKLFNDPDEVVRWRAVEAALAAGKDRAIAPVLAALPVKPYKREDLDSYVVHDLSLLGPSALPALKTALASKSWVARASAVRALALVGTAKDAGALASLEKDATKLPGFPGGATLGTEARAAEQALRAKP